MDLLEYFPDIQMYFQNYKIKGRILNGKIIAQLNQIYEKNFHFDFFKNNITAIDMIIKELIHNSIKANIKRWVIERYNLNPENEEEYYKSLRILKHILYFIKIEDFEKSNLDFHFTYEIYLSFHEKLLIIHVINPRALFSFEEKRVRKKFSESNNLDGLHEYYLSHPDTEEGAGMGIVIINLLLKQLGLQPRNFTIFPFFNSFQSYTVSRVIIPFHKEFTIPRKKFDIYCQKNQIEPHSLRSLIQRNLIYIPFL